MKVTELNKSDFLNKVADYGRPGEEWKYRGDRPAIVDFYANWCGPCRMFAPVLDELADEYAGRIHFYKINTESEQELSAAFGVRSIPTLLFIPINGKPGIVQGALPKNILKEQIEQLLLHP